MSLRVGLLLLFFFLSFPLGAQPLDIQLPKNLGLWMWAEGQLNDKGRFQKLRDHSALDPAHQAKNSQWFEVQSYWVAEELLDVAQLDEEIPKELRSELIRDGQSGREYRLFVHPESKEFYQKLTDQSLVADSVWALATASSRTVLLHFPRHPQSFIFAKLSLDKDLGNVRRTVISSEARQAVGMSVWLKEVLKKIGGKFHFMSEFIGIAPKGWPTGGQVLRAVPKEVLTGEKVILPFFSLTASQSNGRSILEEMIEESGERPYEFVLKTILKPFVREWLRWALEGAYVSELHTQNFLFERANGKMPTFWIRDNNGAKIDASSPYFDPRLLPTKKDFENLMSGYNPEDVIKMQNKTLATYFDRILQNLDRELVRLDSAYVKDMIRNDLWLELRKELIELGLPKETVRIEKIQNNLPEVLQRAALIYKASPLYRHSLCSRIFN